MSVLEGLFLRNQIKISLYVLNNFEQDTKFKSGSVSLSYRMQRFA